MPRHKASSPLAGPSQIHPSGYCICLPHQRGASRHKRSHALVGTALLPSKASPTPPSEVHDKDHWG